MLATCFQLLIFLLFIPLSAFSQLYEIKQGNKWGLMDRTGKTILHIGYDYIYPNADRSYFYTRKGRKTGLFHFEQGELIKPIYDLIYLPNPEEGNYFRIADNGKFGLLDSFANVLIAPKYGEIRVLEKNYFLFRKGMYWGLKSGIGKFEVPAEYQFIINFKHNGELLFFGTNAKGISTIWDPDGREIASNISYSVVRMVGEVFVYKTRGQLGLLDKTGSPITEAIFDEITSVGNLIEVRQKDKSGLLTSLGTKVLDLAHQKISADSTGRVWFATSEGWGVVDINGRIIAEPQFRSKGKSWGPIAKVRTKEGYGVLNFSGDFLVNTTYDEIRVYPYMIRARKDTLWEQIRFDKNGKRLKRRKLIIAKNRREYEFAAYRALRRKNTNEEIGWFFRGGLWGLRDTTNGKVLIAPKYGSVKVYKELGLSLVTDPLRLRQGMKRYGLVDNGDGRELVSPVFAHLFISDLEESSSLRALYGSERGSRMMLILSSGRIKNIANSVYISAPHKGVFRVKEVGKRPKFEEVTQGYNDLEKSYEKVNSSWRLINERGITIETFDNGKKKEQPTFTFIDSFHDGIAVAKTRIKGKNNWVLIDTLQNTLKPWKRIRMIDPGQGAPFLYAQKDSFTFNLLNSKGEFMLSRNAFWITPDSQKKQISKIGNFREGLAKIKVGSSWGFMNIEGEIVIDPQFRSANDFYEGLAAVRIKKGWGFINPQGVIVIKPKYLKARDFHDGLASVKKNKGWGFIDQTGKKVLKFKMRKTRDFADQLGPTQMRYWGLIDTDGNWVVDPIYGMLERNDSFWRVRKDGKFGFLDEAGEIYLPPDYSSLGVASEGMISFIEKARYGFINMEGEKIVPAVYRRVKRFTNGLAAVNLGGRWGFIDKKGITAIPLEYKDAMPFMKGVAPVAYYETGAWGVIDSFGQVVIPFKFRKILRSPEGWLACMDYQDGKEKWEFYDPNGVKLNHQSYESGSAFKLGMAKVNQGLRKSIINIFGVPLTYPGYDDILEMGDEMIIAENNAMIGLVDKRGKEILPPVYEFIEYIDGFYRVVQYGEIGYLDGNGSWIYPLKSSPKN